MASLSIRMNISISIMSIVISIKSSGVHRGDQHSSDGQITRLPAHCQQSHLLTHWSALHCIELYCTKLHCTIALTCFTLTLQCATDATTHWNQKCHLNAQNCTISLCTDLHVALCHHQTVLHWNQDNCTVQLLQCTQINIRLIDWCIDFYDHYGDQRALEVAV